MAVMPSWGLSISDLETKMWKASWITVPGIDQQGYGVYLFRKTFEVQETGKEMTVYVSGDNHYKLYVNGQLVSLGPDRSDVTHWNYDIVDIAPYVKEGKNALAARVWNEGEWRATANTSYQTGFILQPVASELKAIATSKTWRCTQDKGYKVLPQQTMPPLFTGPGDMVEMSQVQRGWLEADFDDSQWLSAEELSKGMTRNKVAYGGPNGWMLQPSPLPALEMKEEHTLKVRQSSGTKQKGQMLTIPAKTSARILLDNGVLTNAYFTLLMNGGKDANIGITYGESMFNGYPNKCNRNEADGKVIWGRTDSIVCDGTNKQVFTSLSFRNYRYIELRVQTKGQSLTIDDYYGTFTGYPFVLNARLDTDNGEIQKMMEIGWRTARLCAVDTYFDCPYFEQLQYIGDTRIQALVSVYNSGDTRLFRNALNLFDQSRTPEGMLMSRYPSHIPQYITTYNLFYVAMLHDYLMYADDVQFVKDKLLGARQVLQYFEQYQQADGSVVNLPWWNFTDWVPRWTMGAQKTDKEGCSAPIDLQLLYALQMQEDLERRIGVSYYADLYHEKGEQLKQTIRKKYWDDEKGLFADRTPKDLFSQHSNSLAILTGLTSGGEAKAIAEKILSDEKLSPASIYYKYYVHRALTKAGLGDDYLNWLGTWREYISLGMTTWGEDFHTESTRSDCHAWGSSPNIEFFRTILGIDSDAPAFQRVRIEPHLGTIKKIGGEMPHPKGTIKVAYDKNATITLPDGVTGAFVWKGKTTELKSGENKIKM